jgi:hypothetical protein
VTVGRAALDEDAIRLIEQHNPELEFDWTRILKGQGSEPVPERRPPPPQQRAVPPRPTQTRPAAVEPLPVAPVLDAVEVRPTENQPLTAAGRKLGAEGLSRLRGRHSEMLARIGDRVPDADRQAELKIIAERLNPDAWVTDADVLAGLDAYESTFESLRSVVGHRRRRSRRPESPAAATPGGPVEGSE